MTLPLFLAAVHRHWRVFAAVAGVVFLLSVGAILVAPPVYTSRVQLMVSVSGTTTAEAYQNDEIVAGRIDSYLALMTSEAITKPVIDTLGLATTPAQLADRVSATNVPPRTSLIDVEVTGSSPDGARDLANALARQFITYTAAIETPTGDDDHKVRTVVVSAASQARDDHVLRLGLATLGMLAALLSGATAVWVTAWRQTAKRTATEPVMNGHQPRPAEPTGAPAPREMK